MLLYLLSAKRKRKLETEDFEGFFKEREYQMSRKSKLEITKEKILLERKNNENYNKYKCHKPKQSPLLPKIFYVKSASLMYLLFRQQIILFKL